MGSGLRLRPSEASPGNAVFVVVKGERGKGHAVRGIYSTLVKARKKAKELRGEGEWVSSFVRIKNGIIEVNSSANGVDYISIESRVIDE